MKTSKFAVLISVLFAMLVLTGCASLAPIYNVDSSSLSNPPDADLAQITLGIKRAGAGLGWQMKKISDGHLLATLNIRVHQAVVDITFDTKTFNIQYKNSDKLKYNSDKQLIHKNYNSWIKNLENAIVIQTGLL